MRIEDSRCNVEQTTSSNLTLTSVNAVAKITSSEPFGQVAIAFSMVGADGTVLDQGTGNAYVVQPGQTYEVEASMDATRVPNDDFGSIDCTAAVLSVSKVATPFGGGDAPTPPG